MVKVRDSNPHREPNLDLVFFRHQNGSMEMLASQVTNNGNAWTRLSKTIGRVDNEFQIVFEGIVGQIGNSDIALDDVVFRDNCL